MYVVSVKSSKLKAIVALVAVFLFFALGIIYSIDKLESSKKGEQNAIDFSAQTAQQRAAFFSQFGWKIDEEPVEVKEVQIPETFDDVYTRYNTLQQEQGFDLSAYCGQRVKSWSYRILNYPGYENDRDHIRGNLLVLDGLVIGGDISNVALDGFMQTFEFPQEQQSVSEQESLQAVN